MVIVLELFDEVEVKKAPPGMSCILPLALSTTCFSVCNAVMLADTHPWITDVKGNIVILLELIDVVEEEEIISEITNECTLLPSLSTTCIGVINQMKLDIDDTIDPPLITGVMFVLSFPKP